MGRSRLRGGVLGLVGYLLSPLSWWNDLFINIPIAYVFALGAALLNDSLFGPGLVIGYWATNVAGFVLLHRSIAEFRSGSQKNYCRFELAGGVLVSLVYTLLIVVLLRIGWLEPLDLGQALDWLGE